MSSTLDPKTDSGPADSHGPDDPLATLRQRAKPAGEKEGIRLSELAAQRVREYMNKTDHPATHYLYVGVKGGGCSGLSYVLDLRDLRSAPVAETDEVFESQGLFVACDLKSYIVGNLGGTLVDFQDGLTGSGFTFNNPNATHSCGCGASYSA